MTLLWVSVAISDAGTGAVPASPLAPTRDASVGTSDTVRAAEARLRMPDARCPTCGEWSPRQDWTDAPGQAFPFVVVCPRCDRGSDVAEIAYRLNATPAGHAPSVSAGAAPQASALAALGHEH